MTSSGRISQGAVRERSPGHWEVRIPAGLTASGARDVYQETLPTKRAAVVRRDELLAKRRQNPDANLRDVLLREQTPSIEGVLLARAYFDDWLDRVEHRIRPRTFVSYKEHVAHAMEIIGDVPAAEVTTADIERVYASYRKRGSKPKTVLNCHRILRAAFTEAVEDAKLRTDNPVLRRLAPRPVKFEIKPPDVKEWKRLTTVADQTPHGAMVRVAALTGLRLGELLALSWGDVDLRHKTIHVRASTTKTQRGRVVDLEAQAVALLRRHQREQKKAIEVFGPAYADKTAVFANGVGKRIDPANMERSWRAICKKADLQFRFHDLRHLHASELLRQGVHPKVVQERLGHASITMTLDTYSHLIPSMQKDVISKVKLFTGR